MLYKVHSHVCVYVHDQLYLGYGYSRCRACDCVWCSKQHQPITPGSLICSNRAHVCTVVLILLISFVVVPEEVGVKLEHISFIAHAKDPK